MGYGHHKNYAYEQIDAPKFKRRRRQITDWEMLEEEMRGALDFNALSDDQKQVFEQVMKWYDERTSNLLTLGGYAGTGKSTLVSILARELERAGNREFRIAFCAYTGKAANVLKQKLHKAGIDADTWGLHHYAGTIHSLIYKPLADGNGAVYDWERKTVDEIADLYSLIVVDEASMVDAKMLEDLESYGLPILAVGDHGQLPPVKGVSTLMLEPELRLEQIHRQAADNPIIQLSQYIRENRRLPENWASGDHVRFCTFDEMFGLLEPLYATEDINDIAILTYKNATRQSMNYQARCMRNRKHMDLQPAEGDQFICLRNVHGTLFNGMRGVLETTPQPHQRHWYNGRFFFPDDELEVEGAILSSQIGREKTFSDFDEIAVATNIQFNSWRKVGMLFDYGYALTVHKSQGSQFKHVFLMFERPGHASADDFARWLYTAATRARETLTIVVG